MGESGATLDDLARLNAFEARTQALGAQYPADAEIQRLCGDTARTLNARINQLKRARFRAHLAEQRKWILGGAAGLAVLIAGSFAIRSFLARPTSISVQVNLSAGCNRQGR